MHNQDAHLAIDSAAHPGADLTLERIRCELSALEAASRLRCLAAEGSPRGIDLMSNDYLGLSRRAELREAVLESLAAGERMASGGSRLLSGNARAWEALEEEFAAFVGTEAALFFTSGYAANVGLLSALLRPEDTVFSDALNHASLIDGIRLSRVRKIIFPHLDLDELNRRLGEPAPAEKFIVVESVFSMDGDLAPLPELAALATRHGASMIVDEAHAAGVFGPEGRGLAAAAGLSRSLLAAVFPCGKALASCGAFIACSAALKSFLVNRARTFVFSTALPPYFAHQIRTALRLARDAEAERKQLGTASDALRTRLRGAGLNTGKSDSQIVPVILGSDEDALTAAARLRCAGFEVRAIRPPSAPEGSARLRISVRADLPLEEIPRIACALAPGA